MISQTPWIERKFNFDFPVGLFPVIVERLQGTLARLRDVTKGHTDEKLSRKMDGKWSPKEIIGHLCDLEALWDARITDFLERRDTLTAADMSNTKTHGAKHNDRPVQDLLAEFEKLRSALIHRVQDLAETEASRSALHPRLQTPMRLVDSLFFVAEHDDHELAKLRKLLTS